MVVDFIFVPLKTAAIDIHKSGLISLLQSPKAAETSRPSRSLKSSKTTKVDTVTVHRVAEAKYPFFRKSALLFVAADALLLLGVISAFGVSPLDFPLLRWSTGAVLLGTPASLLIDHFAKTMNFRLAFVVESGFTIISFAWLCGGFVVLGSSAANAAPLLWWPAFTENVLGMSVMGTACFCLISTSVLSLLLSNEPTDQQSSAR